jgi:signal transduction histidine kinase
MKVFKSLLTLKYENNAVEEIYLRKRTRDLKTKNIILGSITMILSVVNIILYLLMEIDKYPESEHNTIYYQIYTNYASCGLIFTSLILSIFISRVSIQSWICYFNYTVLIFPYASFRNYISFIKDVDNMYLVLVSVSLILYRLSWFLIQALDFLEGFFLNILLLVLQLAYYAPLQPLQLQFRNTIHAFMVIFATIIAYFYIFEKKKCFYFNQRLEDQNKWYDSIIQNMDSGFIKIEENSIKFINMTLLKHLLRSKNLHDLFTKDLVMFTEADDKLIELTKEQTEGIINELFSKMSFHNNINNLGETKWEDCKRILSNNKLKNKFESIGNIELALGERIIYYEVFARYSVTKDINNIYEFIINDISRTKMEERLNAEFKYKTLFLSKVTHEFKNPLLCITELVDQIYVQVNKKNNDNDLKLNENLLNIKSMSDFLIILIKDMDIFSQKTNKRTLKTDIEKVKVCSLVTFCKNIAETLIKKHQKERLMFTVQQENVPEYIYTDEVKTKQILVNLISNSIKFTNTGYVNLRLNYNALNKEIEYVVEDTGKGMTDEQQSKLFQPFFEKIERVNNSVGAGLGLYVVKELASLFEGGELLHQSEINKGTKFIFKSKIKTLGNPNTTQSPLRVPLFKNSNTSIDTLYVDYYPKININEDYSVLINANNNNNNINNMINNNPVIINLNQNFQTVKNEYNFTNNYKFEKEVDLYYIILVDDELISMRSAKRLIENYFLHKHIKVVVLEATDGVECLFMYYHLSKQDINFFIISDESMSYLNGSLCANIINNISKDKKIQNKNFYLLTAYESHDFDDQQGVRRTFTKPLVNNNLNIIMSDMFSGMFTI